VTCKFSLNSGKLKTRRTVSPGSTVVGRELLTKGLLFVKIIRLGDAETRSWVLLLRLNIQDVGH
jgi:hypothetical protein